MEKETKKRKGGAEKVRERKKRALEADAAKSKKITDVFSRATAACCWAELQH